MFVLDFSGLHKEVRANEECRFPKEHVKADRWCSNHDELPTGRFQGKVYWLVLDDIQPWSRNRQPSTDYLSNQLALH